MRTIARLVDRMLCILPFEERFYEGTGVSARFVGHPFAERPPPATPAPTGRRSASRRTGPPSPSSPAAAAREVRRLFPPMLEAAERLRARHPDVQFVVPVAPTLEPALLAPHLARHPGLPVRLAAGADRGGWGPATRRW